MAGRGQWGEAVNNLWSKKLIMGLAAQVGLGVCAFLDPSNLTIIVYSFAAIALIAVGGQSVIDVLAAWFSGRPFLLEQPKCKQLPPQ